MPRNYTKVEHLTAETFCRKSAGEANRQIAESYHLTLKQIKRAWNFSTRGGAICDIVSCSDGRNKCIYQK